MHCYKGEMNDDGNVEVEKREDESSRDLIERFEKEVRKSNLLVEVKKRQYFVKPSKQRRLKKKRARRRKSKKQQRQDS